MSASPSGSAQRLTQHQPQLLDTLYRAAAEPAHWQAVLHQLVEILDARSARLLVLDRKAASVQTGVVINHCEHYYQQYVDHYVNLCPWRPELAQKPSGQLYSTYLDFSCRQPDFLKSRFFNEWAGPQGIHHGMLGTVYQDPDCTVQLLVQRTDGPGHFSREETRAMNTLVPHLQHVCQLRRLYEDNQLRSGAMVRSAETLASPFLLLDASHRVIYLSPRAEALIQASTIMRLQQNRLRLCAPAAQHQFQTACTEAARALDPVPGGVRNGTPPLRLHCPEHGNIWLRILPVQGDDVPLLFTPRRAFVVVQLQPAAQRPAISSAQLQHLFDLTPREAHIACRLAEGDSVQHIAEVSQTQESTVRTHLKRLFLKTGTHSQADLVRCVLTSPACTWPV